MPPWTATKTANSTNKIGDTQQLTQARLKEETSTHTEVVNGGQG